MKKQAYWQVAVLQFIIGILLMNGCGAKPEIDKEQAVAVARQEATRRGWREIEVESVNREEGCWVISLWRLPKTPGGHATVEVSVEGKLVRFVSGK
jgi:hypothetical protein